MTFIHALILGVIEGITEFLPISSTGHMILASRLMGIQETDFVKSFEIVIQLGAILAVIGLYAKTLLTKRQLWIPLIAAFIPTGILGITLYKIVKNVLLGNALITVVALAVGGFIFLITDKIFSKRNETNISTKPIGIKQAIIIGLAQSVSMIPGVSRSAATIIGGMGTGMSREEAVEFSFLLSIPTMAAATGLDLLKSGFKFTGSQWELIAIGFITAFVSAIIAVKSFLSFVKHHDFTVFAIYRIAVAAAFFWFIAK